MYISSKLTSRSGRYQLCHDWAKQSKKKKKKKKKKNCLQPPNVKNPDKQVTDCIFITWNLFCVVVFVVILCVPFFFRCRFTGFFFFFFFFFLFN